MTNFDCLISTLRPWNCLRTRTALFTRHPLHPQVIDVSKSVMNMMAAKIEIAMKKSEPMTWARLDLPAPVSAPAESETRSENDSDGEDE